MNKNTLYIAGILIVIILGVLIVSKSKKQTKEAPLQSYSTSDNIIPDIKEDMDELKIEDKKVGTGGEAVIGKKVTVHYRGTLTDGTEFDSSYGRNLTFSFDLGAGEVIEGWDKGIVGMKVGGQRKLTIPASMGYGAGGVPGSIPPNATLIFDVELFKVE